MNLTSKSLEIASEFARVRRLRYALDMTLGNGRDTLALARMVESGGAVFSFDVQAAALENSRNLILKEAGEDLLEKCRMFLASHEMYAKFIPENIVDKISVAFFNLGWLPGSDKSVITELKSTAEALRSLRGLFVRRARAGEDSLLNVLSYRGHKGAAQEFEFVEKFFNSLEEGGTDLTGVAVSRFGDFENPVSPVLFSARFFPKGRGDI